MDFSMITDLFQGDNLGGLLGLIKGIGILAIGLAALSIVTHFLRRLVLKPLKINHYGQKIVFDSINLKVNLEKWISRIFYWFFFFIVLKVATQFSGNPNLEAYVDSTIGFLLDKLGDLYKAVVPIVIALVFAYVARMIVRWLAEHFNVNQRLSSKSIDSNVNWVKTLGDIAYGFVFLFFLPSILSSLGLQQSVLPVNSMLDKFLVYIPQIVGAGIIFFIGRYVAMIVRDVVSSLLNSIGADRVTQKLNLSEKNNSFKISKIGGLFVYVIILVQVLVQALDKLKLDSVTGPIKDLLNTFYATIPNFIGAAIIIIVAYYVGRLLNELISNLLEGIGFNNILTRLGISQKMSAKSKSPSQLVGLLIQVTLLFLATIEALNRLGFEDLGNIVEDITLFGSQVLVGTIIFGIGLYIAQALSTTIKESTSTHAPILALISKIGILVLTGAMALKRMGLADEIVVLAFGLTLGALCLGTALAIGLGSKETAGTLVKDFVAKLKK